MATYKVYQALGERMVEVSDEALAAQGGNLLEAIFHEGQNDFQQVEPPRPSVSVGDVAELADGSLHICASVGWQQITREQFDNLGKMDWWDRARYARLLPGPNATPEEV